MTETEWLSALQNVVPFLWGISLLLLGIAVTGIVRGWQPDSFRLVSFEPRKDLLTTLEEN